MAKTKNHKCRKSDILWDKQPEGFEVSDIYWYGKCSVCVRKVYEVYEQREELYDAETDKEI